MAKSKNVGFHLTLKNSSAKLFPEMYIEKKKKNKTDIIRTKGRPLLYAGSPERRK